MVVEEGKVNCSTGRNVKGAGHVGGSAIHATAAVAHGGRGGEMESRCGKLTANRNL